MKFDLEILITLTAILIFLVCASYSVGQDDGMNQQLEATRADRARIMGRYQAKPTADQSRARTIASIWNIDTSNNPESGK